MDKFTLRAFPVSTLPETPAARVQLVHELLNVPIVDEAGNVVEYVPAIDAETARRLLGL